MLEKGLVSIITPCYNGEKHIFRLLDSILTQTYPLIEMIIIDDGSIDNSKSVISSYIPKFENKGYTLSYVYQENSGQAAAINRALTIYTGEYLVWPDSDDYYNSPESIAEMVSKLKGTNDKISMVIASAKLVEENSLKTISKITYKKYNKVNHALLDCILENQFNLVPGKFLVKSKLLLKQLEENTIYNSRGGQNWQLLIPLLHNYDVVTIDKILYTIIQRTNSHSRKDSDHKEVELQRMHEHKKILFKTIDRLKGITDIERNKLIDIIELKYKKRYLNFCYRRSMREEYFTTYKEIKKEHPTAVSIKDYIKKTILFIHLK